ncbi:hypothetical protein [Salinicoccus halitifaciens]|uniref:Uncharacterized protein n=1 Tax=Salinicoccus halitifaciens TaxID=1073415 RepID=A0ABV2E5N5_9STAP|nr:hypothetical protein [Salinicoccus halitifaciens]MCD2137185.1 hypothetical protein [Salinicoccus halitifaciens]
MTDFKRIFDEAYQSKKEELEREKNEVLVVQEEVVRRDFESIGNKISELLYEAPTSSNIIRKDFVSFDNEGMKLEVRFEGENILGYEFKYDNSETNKYRILVYSQFGLPHLFLRYLDKNNYYYQEEEEYRVDEGEEYIDAPARTIDDGVEDNNLNKVMIKHVKYIANYIAKTHHGIKDEPEGGRVARVDW